MIRSILPPHSAARASLAHPCACWQDRTHLTRDPLCHQVARGRTTQSFSLARRPSMGRMEMMKTKRRTPPLSLQVAFVSTFAGDARSLSAPFPCCPAGLASLVHQSDRYGNQQQAIPPAPNSPHAIRGNRQVGGGQVCRRCFSEMHFIAIYTTAQFFFMACRIRTRK